MYRHAQPPKLAPQRAARTGRPGSHWLGLALLALSAACQGPSTFLDNPGRHTCYLDGVREGRGEIPFRFYGSSRIDVVPASHGDQPDWSERPSSMTVTLQPPANPWLFPFDLLGEVWTRALHGPGDLTARIEVEQLTAEERLEPDLRSTANDLVSQRARAARIAR